MKTQISKLKAQNGQSLCGKEGQSLFELVVALAVTVLIVTGIVKIVTLSVANSTFAKNQATATRFGQEAIEWLRSEKDKDWTSFSSERSGLFWCLQTLSWSQRGPCASGDTISGTFVRWVELGPDNDGEIDVNVEVSWEDSRGVHSSRVDTVFTNWRGSQ